MFVIVNDNDINSVMIRKLYKSTKYSTIFDIDKAKEILFNRVIHERRVIRDYSGLFKNPTYSEKETLVDTNGMKCDKYTCLLTRDDILNNCNHNNIDESNYLNVMKNILSNGERIPSRTGIDCISTFDVNMSFDIKENVDENGETSYQVPILTTKRIYTKGIIIELLWFLKGLTDTKWLSDKGVHFWELCDKPVDVVILLDEWHDMLEILPLAAARGQQ